jgi:hypothetical protein
VQTDFLFFFSFFQLPGLERVVYAKRAGDRWKQHSKETKAKLKPHTNFDTFWLNSFDKTINGHLHNAFSKV